MILFTNTSDVPHLVYEGDCAEGYPIVRCPHCKNEFTLKKIENCPHCNADLTFATWYSW